MLPSNSMFDPSLPGHTFTPDAPPPWWRRKTTYFIASGAVIIIAAFWLGTLRRVIAVGESFVSINRSEQAIALPTTPDRNYVMPKNDPNRLNVLILGIRGEDDPDAEDGGPLLTDSMQIFSYDKTTHKAAIVSIPRDLWINVHDNVDDKLNTVYEYGYYHSSSALDYTEAKVSEITGVYIDYAVVLDFSAFKQIIDALGGVDVTLTQPFSEPVEWGFPFNLPAGVDHLDGQDALYYARSRYSTSDFDRSRRQQQIMLAMKTKLFQLNFFANPIKTISIFNLVRQDITTDIGLLDIPQFISVAQNVNFNNLKQGVVSTDNFLYQTTNSADGAYILLPIGGNFDQIKDYFQTILN